MLTIIIEKLETTCSGTIIQARILDPFISQSLLRGDETAEYLAQLSAACSQFNTLHLGHAQLSQGEG